MFNFQFQEEENRLNFGAFGRTQQYDEFENVQILFNQLAQNIAKIGCYSFKPDTSKQNYVYALENVPLIRNLELTYNFNIDENGEHPVCEGYFSNNAAEPDNALLKTCALLNVCIFQKNEKSAKHTNLIIDEERATWWKLLNEKNKLFSKNGSRYIIKLGEKDFQNFCILSSFYFDEVIIHFHDCLISDNDILILAALCNHRKVVVFLSEPNIDSIRTYSDMINLSLKVPLELEFPKGYSFLLDLQEFLKACVLDTENPIEIEIKSETIKISKKFTKEISLENKSRRHDDVNNTICILYNFQKFYRALILIKLESFSDLTNIINGTKNVICRFDFSLVKFFVSQIEEEHNLDKILENLFYQDIHKTLPLHFFTHINYCFIGVTLYFKNFIEILIDDEKSIENKFKIASFFIKLDRQISKLNIIIKNITIERDIILELEQLLNQIDIKCNVTLNLMGLSPSLSMHLLKNIRLTWKNFRIHGNPLSLNILDSFRTQRLKLNSNGILEIIIKNKIDLSFLVPMINLTSEEIKLIKVKLDGSSGDPCYNEKTGELMRFLSFGKALKLIIELSDNADLSLFYIYRILMQSKTLECYFIQNRNMVMGRNIFYFESAVLEVGLKQLDLIHNFIKENEFLDSFSFTLDKNTIEKIFKNYFQSQILKKIIKLTENKKKYTIKIDFASYFENKPYDQVCSRIFDFIGFEPAKTCVGTITSKTLSEEKNFIHYMRKILSAPTNGIKYFCIDSLSSFSSKDLNFLKKINDCTKSIEFVIQNNQKNEKTVFFNSALKVSATSFTNAKTCSNIIKAIQYKGSQVKLEIQESLSKYDLNALSPLKNSLLFSKKYISDLSIAVSFNQNIDENYRVIILLSKILKEAFENRKRIIIRLFHSTLIQGFFFGGPYRSNTISNMTVPDLFLNLKNFLDNMLSLVVLKKAEIVKFILGSKEFSLKVRNKSKGIDASIHFNFDLYDIPDFSKWALQHICGVLIKELNLKAIKELHISTEDQPSPSMILTLSHPLLTILERSRALYKFSYLKSKVKDYGFRFVSNEDDKLGFFLIDITKYLNANQKHLISLKLDYCCRASPTYAFLLLNNLKEMKFLTELKISAENISFGSDHYTAIEMYKNIVKFRNFVLNQLLAIRCKLGNLLKRKHIRNEIADLVIEYNTPLLKQQSGQAETLHRDMTNLLPTTTFNFGTINTIPFGHQARFDQFYNSIKVNKIDDKEKEESDFDSNENLQMKMPKLSQDSLPKDLFETLVEGKTSKQQILSFNEDDKQIENQNNFILRNDELRYKPFNFIGDDFDTQVSNENGENADDSKMELELPSNNFFFK